MKVSYYYEDLLTELKEEMGDGNLSPKDTIQILRAEKDIYNGYRPIIDWYYEEKRMERSMTIDIFDDEEDIEKKKKLIKIYKKDKPYLENILVSECISEMQEWNRII